MPPTSPNLVIFIVDGERNHAHGTSGGWPSEGLSDMETTEAKAKDAIAMGILRHIFRDIEEWERRQSS
jgi:hypothetical protein